jgi:hypothetical protein
MRPALALCLLAACADGGPAPAPSAAPMLALSSSYRPPPNPAETARRPTRRFYLGRTEARCEVYAADPDGTSPATPTPCPPDLSPGERIRIAGKVCMRESDDPDRQKPVVCPDPLTDFEQRVRPSAR